MKVCRQSGNRYVYAILLLDQGDVSVEKSDRAVACVRRDRSVGASFSAGSMVGLAGK
jgi:hypothetical protein